MPTHQKLPIMTWGIDDAPEALTIDLPDYNKIRWVTLVPPYYRDDDLCWLEEGTAYGRRVRQFEGPEGALLLVSFTS